MHFTLGKLGKKWDHIIVKVIEKNIINQEKAVSSNSKASKVLPNKKKQKLYKIKNKIS